MVTELLGDRTVRLIFLAVILALLSSALALTYVVKLAYSVPPANTTRIHMQLEHDVDNATMHEVTGAISMRLFGFGLDESKVQQVSGSELYADVQMTDQMSISEITSLLNGSGRYEGIVDGKVAVSNDDILPGSIRAASPYTGQSGGVAWEVGFALTESGAMRFSNVVRGKANYPVYMFVNRPENSVILMTRAEVLGNNTLMNTSEGLAVLRDAMREDNSSMPVLLIDDWNGTRAQLEALNRSAYNKAIVSEGVSPSVASDLQAMGFELVRVPEEDLTPSYYFGDNNMSLAEWKAVGLLTAPLLNPQITQGQASRFFSISGTAPRVGTQQDQYGYAERESRMIKAILYSSPLPVKVSITGTESIAGTPPEGREIIDYALICEGAGTLLLLAIIAVLLVRRK